MVRLCVGLIILSPLARMAGLAYKWDPGSFATVCRLDQLAMGGLLAILMRGPLGPVGVRRRLWPWRYLLLGGITVLVFYPDRWLFESWHFADAFKSLAFSIITLGAGLLLVLGVTANKGGMLGRCLESGSLKCLGKYSYGIYVFHFLLMPIYMVLLPFDAIFARIPNSWGALLVLMLIYSLLSMAVAWLSWHLFEKHFLRLKAKFGKTPHGAPVSAIA